MQDSSRLASPAVTHEIELWPNYADNKTQNLDHVDSLFKRIKPQKYATIKPKIVLEVISAQSAKLILAWTYIAFIFCFSLDIYAVYESFTSESRPLTPTYLSPSQYNGSYTYNATVPYLVNVYSVAITGTQYNNATDNAKLFITGASCIPTTLTYNIKLWGCYQSTGCGKQFVPIPAPEEVVTVWQKVYFSEGNTVSINWCVDTDITINFLSNTFQPQESLPWFGDLQSYFFSIEFTDNPSNLFVPLTADAADKIDYQMDLVVLKSDLRVPWVQVGQGIQYAAAVLLLGTIIVYIRYDVFHLNLAPNLYY